MQTTSSSNILKPNYIQMCGLITAPVLNGLIYP